MKNETTEKAPGAELLRNSDLIQVMNESNKAIKTAGFVIEAARDLVNKFDQLQDMREEILTSPEKADLGKAVVLMEQLRTEGYELRKRIEKKAPEYWGAEVYLNG